MVMRLVAEDGSVLIRHHQASKSHCAQGHPYDDENTYRKGGRRYCRACRRTWVARHRERERERAGGVVAQVS